MKIGKFQVIGNLGMGANSSILHIRRSNDSRQYTIKQQQIPKLVQIFAQVAAGMAHMHRRGVFHADLKPNNILLSRSGEVKIIDYGLAWIKGEGKGRVQGTPEYMAPEQAKKGIVNEQTDMYNLGATMYRLVTWRLPPNSVLEDDALRLPSQKREKFLKPVDELNPEAPPELCELIHKCLEVKSSRRPERMSDVQETLE